MKRLLIRGVLLSLMLTSAAYCKTNIHIRGVKDDLLTNVNARLEELDKNKPLQHQSDAELTKQVALALAPYGYFSPSVKLYRNQQGFPSHISIRKGIATKIRQLNIQVIGPGKDNPAIIKAVLNLPLQRGQNFDSIVYEEAKQSLFDAAENVGYLKSRFDQSTVLVNKKNHSADITLLFNTHKRYYFGRIQFNRSRVSQQLLHRYAPFSYGSPYRPDKIITFNNDLSSSPYFRHVSVNPKINDNPYVPIKVHLDPVPRYQYTLGVGFGTDTGVRGRAGLNVIPVNEKGHTFNAIAQGSMRQNALQAQYVIPGNNPATDQYDLTASGGNQDFSSGYSNSLLFTAAARHHQQNHQRVLSLNVLYERYHYTNFNLDKEEAKLFFPRALFSWRHVDSELFSKNGYNATVTGLAAVRNLLSEHDLGQVQTDIKGAVTSDYLRARLFVHSIQGVTFTSDINQVPLSLAFLLGGADNLKAYGFNSIGPGKLIEYYGIELQKETKDNWYILGFIDAGDVYTPRPKQLKYDIGTGLMWVSPVGPIRVGVAQAVDSSLQRIRGRNPRLVISMGPDLS